MLQQVTIRRLVFGSGVAWLTGLALLNLIDTLRNCPRAQLVCASIYSLS